MQGIHDRWLFKCWDLTVKNVVLTQQTHKQPRWIYRSNRPWKPILMSSSRTTWDPPAQMEPDGPSYRRAHRNSCTSRMLSSFRHLTEGRMEEKGREENNAFSSWGDFQISHEYYMESHVSAHEKFRKVNNHPMTGSIQCTMVRCNRLYSTGAMISLLDIQKSVRIEAHSSWAIPFNIYTYKTLKWTE